MPIYGNNHELKQARLSLYISNALVFQIVRQRLKAEFIAWQLAHETVVRHCVQPDVLLDTFPIKSNQMNDSAKNAGGIG